MFGRKNKGKKLRRRTRVFHRNIRRRTILKNAAMVLAALMIIPLGYLVAKTMENTGGEKSPVSDGSSSSISSTPPDTTVTTAPTIRPADVPDTGGSLRGFYLPAALLRDTVALDSGMKAAADAGFNAVLFDLKDENGTLYYASQTTMAEQSQAAVEDALTLEELDTARRYLEGKGFAAIPRFYAFRDSTAPIRLPTAKVMLADYPGYTWLDNSKDKGGKPWLNPYSTEAHQYIIGLAEELSARGFTAVMIDGVQFPNQTSRAHYGNSELTALSHSEVLKRFMTDLKEAAGKDCRVMQTMPGLSVFGDGTEPFGGNPATFGAQTIAPVLMPSTLGSRLKAGESSLADPASNPYQAVTMAAAQIKLRLELMDGEQPAVMPWLQAHGYSAAQIREQIDAVTESAEGDPSYILYHPQGDYDFSALKD